MGNGTFELILEGWENPLEMEKEEIAAGKHEVRVV